MFSSRIYIELGAHHITDDDCLALSTVHYGPKYETTSMVQVLGMEGYRGSHWLDLYSASHIINARVSTTSAVLTVHTHTMQQ